MNIIQSINFLILSILTFPLIISLLQPTNLLNFPKYVIYSIKLSLFLSLMPLLTYFSLTVNLSSLTDTE